MKNKKLFWILSVLVIAIVGILYFSNSSNMENLEKLHKQLPDNYIKTKAQITKMDEIKGHPIKVGSKSYSSGWIYTYVFKPENYDHPYMGNYVSDTRKFEINDSIDVIYLPDNPKVNEHRK